MGSWETNLASFRGTAKQFGEKVRTFDDNRGADLLTHD